MRIEDEAAAVVERSDAVQQIRTIAQTASLAAVQSARLWNELTPTTMPPELIQALIMQAAAHFWASEFAHRYRGNA